MERKKQKALRRVNDILINLPKTVKKLSFFFDEIKTKKNELTGRINSDVILLKVFK